MCHDTASSASALDARSLSWSVNCSMRCHGTNSAAEMIITTAVPNKSWHLAAREMRSWRIRLNTNFDSSLFGCYRDIQRCRPLGWQMQPNRGVQARRLDVEIGVFRLGNPLKTRLRKIGVVREWGIGYDSSSGAKN